MLGENYTVADVIWTVVLSRLELLGYDDWIAKEYFPNVANYYINMKKTEKLSGSECSKSMVAKIELLINVSQTAQI